MSQEFKAEDKKSSRQKIKPVNRTPDKQKPGGPRPAEAQVLRLQQKVGNQAVQRLLAQRKGGEEGFDLNDETTQRINQERSSGRPLDGAVQKQMSEHMGHDFSGVQVHTSPEANELNQDLSAKAFTTGQDVFFKEGAYDPGSSSGRELLAHELGHVVQQGSGQVSSSGGSGMTVRPAGDSFERAADADAKQATAPGSQPATAAGPGNVQRETAQEEELQMKRDDIQRQEEEEMGPISSGEAPSSIVDEDV